MNTFLFRGGRFLFRAAVFPAAALVIAAALSACAGMKTGQALYKPGVYEGSGSGYRDKIKLRVVLSAAGIEDIEILKHREDNEIGGAALEELREKTLEYGYAPEPDAVSGATASSGGFFEALENALLKGKQ